MTTKFAFEFSRLWKHFENKNFGLISAYRGENSKADNRDQQDTLKKDIRDLGYGYKEIKGAWRVGKDDDVQFEYALFVPNLKKEDGITLGKKYNQDAVIYTENKNIILDHLDHKPNEVFNKLESGLKDSWVSWSEFKRHKFRFSEVLWELSIPADPPTSWMSAMSLESFKNDQGISEYGHDLKRALLINKVKQKLGSKP